MRIATWNLERPKDTRSLANAARGSEIQRINADIWVFTETSAAISLSGYVSRSAPEQLNYHRRGESYVAIHSRFPILQQLPTWDQHLSICLEIQSSLGPTLVYGTIITYANDKGVDGTSKRWAEHRKALRAQVADWRDLRKSHPQHTLVIAGDFNQSRDGSGWYEDADSVAVLSDALNSLEILCLTEQNFRDKFGLDRASIDHICVSARACSVRTNVGVWPGTSDGIRMSDHNGVFVDIDT